MLGYQMTSNLRHLIQHWFCWVIMNKVGINLDPEPKSYILNQTENFGMTKIQTDPELNINWVPNFWLPKIGSVYEINR